MRYEDINDEQLIVMLHESSEDAKDILFEKYRYIIEIELKKYSSMARVLGYDYNDLYQDALVGFSDALVSYRSDKHAALASFITLCVDRKLQVCIKKAGRLKNKLLNESLSLEHVYDAYTSPLMDMLSDNNKNDALLEEINSRALNSRIILPYSKSNVMAKKEIGAIDSDFNYVLDSLKRDINLALNEIF